MTALREMAVVTTTAPATQDLDHLMERLAAMQADHDLCLRVVVTDDLGFWRTPEAASQYANGYPSLNITTRIHDRPKGQFAAMLAGVQLNPHLYTLLIDPDMHACLERMPELLRAADDADIVHCVRCTRPDIGLVRRLGSAVLNGLVRRITGLRIADLQSPMMLLSPTVLAALPKALEKPGNPRLYLYSLFRERIASVPVNVTLTAGHRSHYTLLMLTGLAFRVIGDAWQLRRQGSLAE